MISRIGLPVLILLFCLSTASYAQTLPLDPAVKMGKLPNGFTYYIRKNTEPAKRAQLYLVNKVGSILEAEDQRGLAHFMEHMNFNGTRHFPKNALVNYLEKNGVKFGADLNAYTSFDETVYQLPIPTDDPSVFKNGLQIMRDWAQEALLDPVEIDKERGVVLEEKRLGMGAGERLQRKYLPLLLNQSRYAQRLPIGTDSVLNHFQRPTLHRFLKDWYRPDLQALIVVGDIDPKQVEIQIKKLFSDLKNPPNKKPRTKYSVALTGNNQFLALADKELEVIELQVLIKHKKGELKTAADYRKSIVQNLFNQMLQTRYAELSQQPSPPFVQANAGINDFLGGLDIYSINLVCKPGKEKAGFQAALMETERVKRFGFTATELERAKMNYQSSINSALRELGKTPSINYVQEYQQHFLMGEASPGIVYEQKLVTAQLKTISLKEVNALAVEYITDSNRDILVMGPELSKTELPKEAAVEEWIAEVKKHQLEPYTDQVSAASLLTSAPQPGRISEEKKIEGLGVTEWVFNNGVKVILKPTFFKNDEILFRAFSPGGTSLSNDSDYQSAANAANIVTSFGIGAFDAIQLSKQLTGKKLRVVPYIAERFEGFSGSAIPQDLETALQLVYLYFTAPRKDSILFSNILERSVPLLENRYNDPDNVFSDTMNYLLGGYHPRRKGPTVQDLSQVQLDKVFHIYQERFADASDFTFVFTGSFTLDSMKPLLEKYIGSLPSIHRNESASDLGIQTPSGIIEKKVYKGSENKATVRVVYSGDLAYSHESILDLDAITGILQFRLTERLREEESGVYSPSVRNGYSKYPRGRYSITVSFGCAPTNIDKLINAMEEEIEKVKAFGPKADDLQKFIAEEQRDLEKQEETNAFWLSWLVDQYQNGEDPRSILQYRDQLKKLDAARVKQAANLYIGANRIVLELLPEQ